MHSYYGVIRCHDEMGTTDSRPITYGYWFHFVADFIFVFPFSLFLFSPFELRLAGFYYNIDDV